MTSGHHWGCWSRLWPGPYHCTPDADHKAEGHLVTSKAWHPQRGCSTVVQQLALGLAPGVFSWPNMTCTLASREHCHLPTGPVSHHLKDTEEMIWTLDDGHPCQTTPGCCRMSQEPQICTVCFPSTQQLSLSRSIFSFMLGAQVMSQPSCWQTAYNHVQQYVPFSSGGP